MSADPAKMVTDPSTLSRHNAKDRVPHPSGKACRICSGSLQKAFDGIVLGDVKVVYGVCEACETLQLPEPFWLDRSYSTILSPNPDTGVVARSSLVLKAIHHLERIGLLKSGVRVLDFGTGKGVLLRQLLKRGLDAWGYDVYPNPENPPGRVSSEIPDEEFSLITCIEVLEHTTEPIQTLRRLGQLTSPEGLILLSTEFFDPRKHGPTWWYLVPQHGQHVTIFSESGFARAVASSGLIWYGTVPLEGRPFLHFLSRKDSSISRAQVGKVLHALRWYSLVTFTPRLMEHYVTLMTHPAVLLKKLRARLQR